MPSKKIEEIRRPTGREARSDPAILVSRSRAGLGSGGGAWYRWRRDAIKGGPRGLQRVLDLMMVPIGSEDLVGRSESIVLPQNTFCKSTLGLHPGES